MKDPRKQSIYFPADILEWLQVEAIRQDRSLSWVVQRCIRVAQASVEQLPTAPTFEATLGNSARTSPPGREEPR